MAEWIGAISALAGTGIGGYVTYKVSEQRYRHEKRAEEEKRIITSSEAIHELLSEISGQASTLNLGVIGHLGYNSPIKGDAIKETVKLSRLSMLVDFYAPSLQTDVKAISDKFTTLVRTVCEVMLNINPVDEWKSSMVLQSATAAAELAGLVVEAQKKLASMVRSTIGSDAAAK